MKGVLLRQCPDLNIVDITHLIPPQDVSRGAYELSASYRYFPAGTIFLAVIDPGVGTSRKPIVFQCPGYKFVGPDNGVFSLIASEFGEEPLGNLIRVPGSCSGWEIDENKVAFGPVSSTFHGRDIFAPAAAALARGDSLESLGVEAKSPIIRRTPEPVRRSDGAVDGEVILVDRFGNAVTNLLGMRGGTIEVGRYEIAVRRTYSEVPVGEPVALVGSMGFIEIGVRDGDAARELGLARGATVTLRTSR